MKPKKMTLRIYGCCMMIAASFFSFAWAEDNVAATVNSVPLQQGQLDLLVKSYVARGWKDGDELRKQATQELANREAVAQEALKLGLDKSPEMIAAMENARRDLLVNSFQADYAAKYSVSDAEIKALYEQEKEEAGDKEYRIRQVLVKTEAEAKEVLAALKKGEKLDELAREKSLDSASRAAGGDIGWKVPVMLVSSVRDVVRNMAKGQTSEQIESPFGWHVIRLEDVRPYEFPPLDKIKPALQRQLQVQATRRAVEQIIKSAQIKY